MSIKENYVEYLRFSMVLIENNNIQKSTEKIYLVFWCTNCDLVDSVD